jgi:predicted metalloprotease with PDZ domain
MWGGLPFDHYVFILNFRPGGGGLEHLTSTLITSGADGMKSEGRYRGWLSLVSHEYFHTFNVKRLRPIELGPFDYENPPRTPSLWISEGLTSYYGDLILCRAGLASPAAFLQSLSSHISQLQNSPGRLEQSLAQASMEVWTNSRSGVQTKDNTVSYYIKGPVVGFLLDARVRAATDGKRSLDDVMRLAYKRYSGERGFKPEEFIAASEEIAGTDLTGWFQSSISSPGELDYTGALDYFGLQLTKSEGERSAWKLEPQDEATEQQKQRLNDWLTVPAK